MPLVKLLRTHVVAAPGQKVVAFGHEFTMEPDGTCTCDMHEDFIEAEVAAGRVALLSDEVDFEEPEKTEEDDVDRSKTDPLKSFGMDIEDYFGTKNFSVFMGHIKKLDKKNLKIFAHTRLRVNFPANHTKDKMIDHIKEMVQLAHKKG